MNNPNIFLSVAWPFTKKQAHFMDQVQWYFRGKGYLLNKVEIQRNNQNSTIKEVLNTMVKCDGMIVIAFKRMEIKNGIIRPNCDLDKGSKYYKSSEIITSKFRTSDWCNIEIGMAFGMKLPILIFLDDSIMGQEIYVDEGIQIIHFNLDKQEYDLKSRLSKEWLEKVKRWETKL